MKNITIKIFGLMMMSFVLLSFFLSEEREGKNDSTDDFFETFCENNLLQNGDFQEGKNGRITDSNLPGWKPINSPRFSPHQEDGNTGFVSMWGNKVVGQGIYQVLKKPLEKGKTYKLSFSVHARQVKERPDYAQLQVRAANTLIQKPNSCEQNNCQIIGVSRKVAVKEGWVNIIMTGEVTDNFDYLIFTPENEFAVNDGEKTSALWLDNICLKEAEKVESPSYYLQITNNVGVPNVKMNRDSTLDLVFKDLTIRYFFEGKKILKFEKAFPTSTKDFLQQIYFIQSVDPIEFEELIAQQKEVFPYFEKIEKAKLLYTPNDYGNTGGNPNTQPNLDLIRAQEAWDITKGDPNVVIGITDIYVETSHEDLQNNLINVWGNNLLPTNPFWHNHGSQVAGCASPDTDNNKGISGIGFNCKIHFSSNWGLYNELLKLSQNGAKVLNASWGACMQSLVDQNVIDEIYQNGTVVVAGAGNGLTDQAHCGLNGHDYLYPASYDHVISVTSIGHRFLYGNNNPHPIYGDIDWQDVHEWQVGNPLSTHTHNDKVDLSAPGYGVTTLEINNGYAPLGFGTSFASPQVAGLCGLLFSVNPCFSPDDIEYILKQTAVNIDNIPENQSYAGLLGSGRIDAYEAVKMATQYGIHSPINGTTTWNTEKFVHGELVVKAGATLTITDKVRFSKDSKLVVEQGAVLIVSGGTLTNSSGCKEDFWNGIEVWGDENNPSFNAQGRVILSNATLKNARNGIVNYQPFSQGTNGGVILAANSVFKNNWRAIAIHTYDYANPRRGVFNNCQFLIDDDYISTDVPFAMATLWGVDRYVFRGCRFADDRAKPTKLIKGIFSADAGYEIERYPIQNGNPSTFFGFDVAIEGNNTGSFYTISIDGADFGLNNKAIVFEGMDGAKLTENNFIVGRSFNNSSVDVGVTLFSSSFFTIEENEFLKATDADPINAGLLIQNSGGISNLVYNNKFSQFKIANWAKGQNNNIDTNSIYNCWMGLEYHCNENINNDVDFQIEPFNTNEGIKKKQGSPNLAAGNTFSTGLGSTHFLVSGACPIDYFYYDQGVNEMPNSGVTAIPTNAGSPCNSFQRFAPVEPSMEQVKNAFDDINALKQQLEALPPRRSRKRAALENTLYADTEEAHQLLKLFWVATQTDTTLTKDVKFEQLTELLVIAGMDNSLTRKLQSQSHSKGIRINRQKLSEEINLRPQQKEAFDSYTQKLKQLNKMEEKWRSKQSTKHANN
ncbi:MAG: S8 family serine peptidase [Bacteroidota bacterium]